MKMGGDPKEGRSAKTAPVAKPGGIESTNPKGSGKRGAGPDSAQEVPRARGSIKGTGTGAYPSKA